MRTLTGAYFQSIDGVIQGGGGPEEDPRGGFAFGGWTVPLSDDSADPAMAKIYMEPDYDLLLARRTYDIFAAYWPYNEDDPIGAKFKGINKYVLTHREGPLTWANSERLCGDTAEVVGKLKASPGRDLLIQGSGTIYSPLVAAGLIDRLIVMTFPVVLGPGRRAFDGAPGAGAFRLVDHFVSDSGVIIATYERSGEVQTGTFATKPPSAAEVERFKRWERGDEG
jgi:dihydrofolate reductase